MLMLSMYKWQAKGFKIYQCISCRYLRTTTQSLTPIIRISLSQRRKTCCICARWTAGALSLVPFVFFFWDNYAA